MVTCYSTLTSYMCVFVMYIIVYYNIYECRCVCIHWWVYPYVRSKTTFLMRAVPTVYSP